MVRYFGGIKLGTSGLIEAYRTAAAEALSAADIVEKLVEDTLEVYFEYPLMGEAMRIVKEEGAKVLVQDFTIDCRLKLSLRRSLMPKMRDRFEKVLGIDVKV